MLEAEAYCYVYCGKTASSISLKYSKMAKDRGQCVGVCEFTGLECENGALEWSTGVFKLIS